MRFWPAIALMTLTSLAGAGVSSSANALGGSPEIIVGNQLPGTFFAKPEGDGPFPVIILLGGSEGGDRTARSKAPLFLAEGYAVLGVPIIRRLGMGRMLSFPSFRLVLTLFLSTIWSLR